MGWVNNRIAKSANESYYSNTGYKENDWKTFVRSNFCGKLRTTPKANHSATILPLYVSSHIDKVQMIYIDDSQCSGLMDLIFWCAKDVRHMMVRWYLPAVAWVKPQSWNILGIDRPINGLVQTHGWINNNIIVKLVTESLIHAIDSKAMNLKIIQKKVSTSSPYTQEIYIVVLGHGCQSSMQCRYTLPNVDCSCSSPLNHVLLLGRMGVSK